MMLTRTRSFRDCEGKKHTVWMSREDMMEEIRFTVGFTAVCLLWGVAVVVFSGILW